MDTKISHSPLFEFNYNIPAVSIGENEDENYLVYRTLTEAFIPFRKYKQLNPIMPEAKFVKSFNEMGYTTIQAVPDEKVEPNHPYKQKLNIIFIDDIKWKAYSTVSNLPNIYKLIPEHSPNDKTIIIYNVPFDGKQTTYNKLYNEYESKNTIIMKKQDFYLVKPHKAGEPRYSIITAPIEEYLKNTKYTTASLQVIYDIDPAILWHGIPGGSYVRIERDSPNTGKTFEYKKVIKKKMT
jgi:DNA-directed RNA polymerase subunit H (RpoH/RPB5)